jgi:repressor LexA
MLQFISIFIDINGFSPTVREIAHGVRLRSTHMVWIRLSSLKRKGYITWLPASPRTIRILKRENHVG